MTPNVFRPKHVYVPLSLFTTFNIRSVPSSLTLYLLPELSSFVEPLYHVTFGLGEPTGRQEITAVPLLTAFVISSGSILPLSKLGAAAKIRRNMCYLPKYVLFSSPVYFAVSEMF